MNTRPTLTHGECTATINALLHYISLLERRIVSDLDASEEDRAFDRGALRDARLAYNVIASIPYVKPKLIDGRPCP